MKTEKFNKHMRRLNRSLTFVQLHYRACSTGPLQDAQLITWAYEFRDFLNELLKQATEETQSSGTTSSTEDPSTTSA